MYEMLHTDVEIGGVVLNNELLHHVWSFGELLFLPHKSSLHGILYPQSEKLFEEMIVI